MDADRPSIMLEKLTVNEVIRAYPTTIEIFNGFGIDACCGGSVDIESAAVRDGVSPALLEQALLIAIEGPK